MTAAAVATTSNYFDYFDYFDYSDYSMVQFTVTTVTFCNPHQRIPESSAPFPSPHAQSRNLTLIPNSEHLFPITLDHSQPDRLYLSLVSSSSLSLASSHMLPLPLSRSLHLTLLVLRLHQPYTI